jgi:polar amino acid transport system substrate-binding protein
MANWTQIAIVCWATLSGVPGALAAPAEPVRIITSDLPPFSMDAGKGTQGALHEMVSELLRRTRVPGKIEFVPWQRAVYLSTKLSRTAIFPLTRSPEREQRYRWLARLYHEHFLFMSIKGRQFDVLQPLQGKDRRVGVLRGSHALKDLRDAGFSRIVEASSVDENLRYLRRGIVDAVFGDRSIYRASLEGRTSDHYVMSAPLRSTTTWLGGSLDFSDADAAQFQKAMKEMMDDGTYAQILKKYGLDPGP